MQKIATGASFLGEKAKALGLIDEIGGIFEVEKYLEEKIGGETGDLLVIIGPTNSS